MRSFLLGVLLGLTFAVLLAPAPGRDTRSRILREAEHVSTATRELGEKVARKSRQALTAVAATLDRIARR